MNTLYTINTKLIQPYSIGFVSSVSSYGDKATSIILATFTKPKNPLLNYKIVSIFLFCVLILSIVIRAITKQSSPLPESTNPLLPETIDSLRVNPRIAEATPIGFGRFSNVIACRTVTGNQYAIKQARLQEEDITLINAKIDEVFEDAEEPQPLESRNAAKRVALSNFKRNILGHELDILLTIKDKEAIIHPGLSQGTVVHFYENVQLMQDSLTFELLDCNLRTHRLRQPLQRFSHDLTLCYITQVANGLGFLHNPQGGTIVHGDIKELNLLLSADGMTIKIADFGLATILTPLIEVEEARHKGTPSYMSPEYRLTKEPQTSDDWWALGVIFKQCITGIETTFNITNSGDIIPESKHLSMYTPYENPNIDPRDGVLFRRLSDLDIRTRLVSYTQFRAFIVSQFTQGTEWTEDATRPYSLKFLA